MLRAWRKRGQCRAAEDPLPWVGRIAHNEGRRYWARSGREDLQAEPRLDATIDWTAGVLDSAEVARALSRLGAAERLVVELRYAQDQTHHAIAGQLGMPVGTVKARLHRARRRLKEALEEDRR
jgi:RNA polymerase sigma-70 factor (ECF subfamily)